MIEFTPTVVPYWGLAINNYWFEVLDYGAHGSHVNNRTTRQDPMDGFSIAISVATRGIGGELDTCGHRVGEIVFRWSRTDLPLPELAASLVSNRNPGTGLTSAGVAG